MAIPADPAYGPPPGPPFGPALDAHGRPVNPRTRAPLGTGQLVALIFGAMFAAGSIAVCSMLSLLLAFAADSCGSGSGGTRESYDACMAAMGYGVAIAYGSFFVLFVAGLVLLCVTRFRPLVRIGGLYLIGLLAPLAMTVAWYVAAAGQP